MLTVVSDFTAREGNVTYAKRGQQVVRQASILDYDKDSKPPEPHQLKQIKSLQENGELKLWWFHIFPVERLAKHACKIAEIGVLSEKIRQQSASVWELVCL